MPGRLLSFVGRRLSSSSAHRDALDSFKKSSTSISSADSVSDNSSAMEAAKKSGISLGRKSKHQHHQEELKHTPISLALNVESPPLVFYGTAEQSTGALFSGQIELTVHDDFVEIEKFTAKIDCVTEIKKPVSSHCKDCAAQVTQLTKWSLIPEGHSALKLARGKHTFPASYLFPGHLPTTCRTSLCNIIYRLGAIAVPKPSLQAPPASHGRSPASSPALGPLQTAPASLSHELHLCRAILPSLTNTHLSVRVFPPTTLTARITHPSIIHPIGSIPMNISLTNISTVTNPLRTPASSLIPASPIHLRWRLRKFFWRLEQTVRCVSPACSNPQHTAKVGGPGNGMQHDNVSILGKGEVSSGWKSDFTPETGKIDWEGEFTLSAGAVSSKDSHKDKDAVSCTNASPAGLNISHKLILEMIVAEEWAPAKRPNHPTPTGAARILRTSVDVKMTERAGLGVSWDEEAPPIYQDVPASPPGYEACDEVDVEGLRRYGVGADGTVDVRRGSHESLHDWRLSGEAERPQPESSSRAESSAQGAEREGRRVPAPSNDVRRLLEETEGQSWGRRDQEEEEHVEEVRPGEVS